MTSLWIWNKKAVLYAPLIFVLLFAFACGSSAEPVIVEKEVIREVIKEVPVIKEVIKEVLKEIIVEKEVVREVVKEVVVFATPVAGVHKVAERPAWVDLGAKKHFNGAISFVHRANPGFLDVHYGASSTTTLLPSGPRFNQLLQYDPTAPDQIVGDLGESWEVSEDGMSYTFHIAEANWQDGVPVTADDIVFSLDRMAQEGVTRGRVTAIRDFYQRGTAKAIDDRTVVMPLKNPSATALGWLAVDYYKIYARHVVESKNQDELNCCFENNIGSGPWVFKEWKKGDSYEFERNADYFKNPIPFYETHKVYIIKDAARRLASLKTGQVQGWLVMGGTTLQDMLQVQKESEGLIRAVSSGAGAVRGFWFNTDEPPFDDPRVRKAVYLTLDRDEIMSITHKGENIVGNFFPPGYVETEADILKLPGFRRGPDGGSLPGDIADAKKLLAEAGLPDGFDITFNVDGSKQSRTEAELIAAQLKDKLNINTDLQVSDRATFYTGLRDGTHNLSTIGTGLYFLEPQTVLVQWYVKDTLRNPHNWEKPRLNELMAAESKELDQVARRELYKEMADILNEGDSHYVVLGWTGRAGAVDYRIQNFKPPYHPHTLWRWDQIWWDPDAKNFGPDAPPIR